MEINPIFFMEFVLFSGLALAWAIWEWWKTGKEIERDKVKKAAEEAAAARDSGDAAAP